MELLIRSQDKTILTQIGHLEIFERDNGSCVIKNFSLLLGWYKSKERALEVLDEIQEAQLGNYHYRCPSNVKVSNNENMIVYEMPKE